MFLVEDLASEDVHVVRVNSRHKHGNNVEERVSQESRFNLASKITITLATDNTWRKDLLLITDTFRHDMAKIKGDFRG